MSYSPVYSVPFIIYAPGAPNNSFEVPSGYTAVVREFDLYTELGGTQATCQLYNTVAPVYVNFAALLAVGAVTTAQWRGHVAVPGGYIIALNVDGLSTGDSAFVGGYLLQNTIS